MKIMTSHRNTNLDWIRTLAIFLVITVHTWSLAKVSDFPLLQNLYQAFIGCGVPLFLMISGALNLSGSVHSFADFYGKRFKRLLIPFLIWAFVVYIISALFGKYADISSPEDAIKSFIPYLLENKINMAYWYIPLMVILYAFTPFLQKALLGCSHKVLWNALGVWLLLLTLRNIYPAVYLLRYTSELLFYAGLYVAGFVIYNQPKERIKSHQQYIYGVILSLALLMLFIDATAPTLWRALTCLSAFALLLKCRLPKNKVIQNISLYSYAIYLFHMVFIQPLYTLFYFNGTTAPLWKCSILPLLTSVVVLTICYGVRYAIRELFKGYKWLGIN